MLVTLVDAYESKHYPRDLPGPVEAIKFEMERRGLTVKDLRAMMGKSEPVYIPTNRHAKDVLTRKQ